MAAPANTVAPVVSGTPTEGQVLSCTTGTWTSDSTPSTVTYTYQWKRNGSNISAATASSYTLLPADVTKSITCLVTATNADGATTQLSNAKSPIVAITPLHNTVAPTITGQAVEGSTLTAHPGTWAGEGTISFAYQWKRNGSNIGGATASTHVVVAADDGTTLSCVVTATSSTTPESVTATATEGATAQQHALVHEDGTVLEYFANATDALAYVLAFVTEFLRPGSTSTSPSISHYSLRVGSASLPLNVFDPSVTFASKWATFLALAATAETAL